MTLFLFRSPSIVILTFVVILAVVDANSLYTVVIMAFNDNENDNSDTVNVETDSLISSSKKYETMEIHEIFQQTNSSSKGLTNIYARSIRKLHGLNKIKVAEDCPPWLCCLLGLKQQSKTAKLLEKCIPQSASVLRDGKYLLLDVESVVVGDIVRLSAGQSIPADIRIFEVSHL